MNHYLENSDIKSRVDNSPFYQKTAETLFRLPTPNEIGSRFKTFVLSDGNIRLESETVVPSHAVIARNKGAIGQSENGDDLFNEWVVERSVFEENYGDVYAFVMETFKPFKKIKRVQATVLDQEILNLMGATGDILFIPVSWSDTPMQARIGDFLTSEGCSVSAHDFGKTYEEV